MAAVIGAAGGAAGTVVWLHRRLTSELPMHAYMQAETLARLDRNDSASALSLMRVDLAATLQAASVNADKWGVDMSAHSRELRGVATFLSRDPSVKLPPEAASLMARFPPYTEEDLASGRCQSGICQLARPKPSSQPARPTRAP